VKIKISFLMLALLMPDASAQGEDSEKLGRLFFTPDQRNALDRQAGLMPSGQPGAPQTEVTIDGEIWHKAERRARWINGENTADAGTPSIPVGDRYQHATGKRQSLLGDGRLTIKPARSSK